MKRLKLLNVESIELEGKKGFAPMLHSVNTAYQLLPHLERDMKLKFVVKVYEVVEEAKGE